MGETKKMATAGPATTQGKEYALKKLQERRAKSREEKQIDNSSLYAGSPMYYYCRACGQLAQILPETHTCAPKALCDECQALKDCGWLE